MRAETRVILNNSFSEKDKKDFKKFSMIIQKQYMDKNAQRKIWEYDQKLGGFGGYAALHVETLVKIILSKHKLFKFIYNRRELGKNIEQLYKENIISYELYERLNDLKKVLNYAKHDTDPKEQNTFDSEDAIVFYFEVRKIGNELLKIINHPTYGQVYEINEDF